MLGLMQCVSQICGPTENQPQNERKAMTPDASSVNRQSYIVVQSPRLIDRIGQCAKLIDSADQTSPQLPIGPVLAIKLPVPMLPPMSQ